MMPKQTASLRKTNGVEMRFYQYTPSLPPFLPPLGPVRSPCHKASHGGEPQRLGGHLMNNLHEMTASAT